MPKPPQLAPIVPHFIMVEGFVCGNDPRSYCMLSGASAPGAYYFSYMAFCEQASASADKC